MINKQNLWFATLFSLILILGIYYVTLADDNLLLENIEMTDSPVIEFTESDSLMAIRIATDEKNLKAMEEYELILLDDAATLEEKNDAYENIQTLKNKQSKTEEIETKIKSEFNMDSVVDINNDQINVTIAGNNHDSLIANNIIRLIQSMYDAQMYITVKFEG